MKITQKLIPVFVCILLSGTVLFTWISGKTAQIIEAEDSAPVTGKKPFEELKASEIASATVQLLPPDKTIQITDMEELTDFLSDAVIYQADNSYTEYVGQAAIFTLTMSDGSQIEIMEYNPFLVIDGVGYRTEYEPCEALNDYANRLLNDENSTIILKEPPLLNVISDETCYDALTGAYSWQTKNDDGTLTNTEADSAHPLDCKDLMDPWETPERTALLRFTEEPDEILRVCCWSDKHWSDSAAESENVPVNGNEIELKPGGYIYEVTARWDTEKNGYGGTARYSFYAKVLE
ncbi:MAG TPA: hypothetical protein DF613_07965 [Lachnospiraceae bacterium]|nr:hypothetical protein [Lachnospiraceae bacterium]